MAYLEFLKSARGRIVDDLLILKAKGTVATSMVGENPVGTDYYIDVGPGRTRGDVVTNVYASSYVSGGTSLVFRLQGSLNAAFSTYQDLQILEIGDSTQIGGSLDLTTGRYVQPFTNDLDGTVYRYLRHYATIASSGTGWQYDCYLSNIAS